MPRLSIFFIRSSLIYLLVGVTYGGLLLWNKVIPFSSYIWLLRPAHIDVMFVGWMTQFALGVAFWILPRRGSEKPRGNEAWSIAAFTSINISLLFSIFRVFVSSEWVILSAQSLQVIGLISFFIGNWWRIYPLKFPSYLKPKT